MILLRRQLLKSLVAVSLLPAIRRIDRWRSLSGSGEHSRIRIAVPDGASSAPQCGHVSAPARS